MGFPLDEKYVQAAEAESGASFPSSYKQAMMDLNGGVLTVVGDTWHLHPIKDTSDKKRIKRTCNHVLLETRTGQENYGFPNNALRIADNGSGDALALVKDSDVWTEKVYLFDHETGGLKDVADDIGKLLEKRERN